MSAAADERVFVGLGGNLGDVAATFQAALEAIEQLPDTRCVARSSLYRSTPVDAGGPPYLNAVVQLQTHLTPLALLHALQAIETRFGRERPYHHAPRTLDLDLLRHGSQRIATTELTLPHPRLHERAFVLVPLAEIAPDLAAPVPTQQAIERLAEW